MLYHWYELGRAAAVPTRLAAETGRLALTNPLNPMSYTYAGRQAAAACLLLERTTRSYTRPSFGIEQTTVDGSDVDVREHVILEKPFGRLLKFDRQIEPERAGRDPKLLIVAPMSGHFATLLRGTIEGLLPTHEVYITDWHCARTVPTAQGAFSLDDYIDYVIEMLALFDGDVHVLAVCQPSVPVLAAVARLEMEDSPHSPHSVILAGGPIDTRINPTIVNKFATSKGLDWFRQNVISRVPFPHAGYGREVYPGFLQAAGFISMNLDRHLESHRDLFMHSIDGNQAGVSKHVAFYDEYLAVMDLDAAFYLQTIDKVFVNHQLPKGSFRHRDVPVELAAIHRPALMTIEGEKDDITGIGQCSAAHDLCGSIPDERRAVLVAEGAGHYGIFSGSRFRQNIVPRINSFTRRYDRMREEVADFSSLDRRLAAARARGLDRAPSSDATHKPADNDARMDPLAARLRAAGLGAVGNPAHSAGPEDYGPMAMAAKFWQFTNHLIIDSFFGFEDSLRRSRGHKVDKPGLNSCVEAPEATRLRRSGASGQRS